MLVETGAHVDIKGAGRAATAISELHKHIYHVKI